MKKLVFTKDAFVAGENALSYLKELGAKKAVIVTGGKFHERIYCGKSGSGFFRRYEKVCGLCLLWKKSGFLVRQNGVLCMVLLQQMIAMLAQQYDGNYDLAARGVALTAILAVVTMPVVSVLMGT